MWYDTTQLKPTSHGLELCEPARDILFSMNERFESRLDADDLDAFYHVVSKLLQDDELEEAREMRKIG